MKKKTIICMIVLILILIVGVIYYFSNKPNIEENNEKEDDVTYVQELSEGGKINVSEELNSSKIYNGLEIKNIQFTEKDGMSILLADIKNNNTTEHKSEIVEITILGENQEIIAKINPVIGNIKAGEIIKLNATVTADIVNAKDFIIKSKE